MDFSLTTHILKIPALVGIIFIIAGGFMYIFPAKKINMLYGYRTKNSMRNKETWRFSQIYGAKKTVESGSWLLLLSLLGYLVEFNETNELIISIPIIIIFSFYPILLTEKALKSKFKKRKKK